MRPREATLEFLLKCRAAKSAQDVAGLLFAEMANCGIAYVACLSHVDPLRPPAGAVAMLNYPASWLAHFSENNYARRDPIFWGAHSASRAFWWEDFIKRQKLAPDQKRILKEAAECGVAKGMTIPIHSPGALPASCSLVPGPDGVDPLILPDLHFMALHAHEEARRLCVPEPRTQVVLTKRQHECLTLAGKGKSDFSIGQILQISPRTAHHTIENAKKRYDVAHRIQAVFLAVLDGQISVSDLAD